MPTSIWDKYKNIDEDPNNNNNPKIKTYKAKIIIKQIISEDKKEYYKIKGRIEKLKKN